MPTASLTITVQPGTDSLHRIVCICRRRNLEISELHYADVLVKLTISGADRQLRGIDRWLASLLHVVNVRRDSIESCVRALAEVPASPMVPAIPRVGTSGHRNRRATGGSGSVA